MNTLSESDRFKGWMLFRMLKEQMEQNVHIPISNEGPDPEPFEKLYFKRQEIFDTILQKINDMAPHGVSSEQQFHDIVEQAINTIYKEIELEVTPEQLSDVVLTISDIEREFRATPYTMIGIRQTTGLNEDLQHMGKAYEPKEALMTLVKSRLLAKGSPAISPDEYKALLASVTLEIKEEMNKTLDMIERTLRMIPPSIFFMTQ